MLHGLMVLMAVGAAEKVDLIQGTSGARSDTLELHSGGVVVRQGSAGSAFGTVRVGKGKRQLSYFVVLKHRLGSEGDSALSERAMAEDTEGESKQTVTIDGKTLQVDYKIKLEPATKKVAKETLTINDKSVDIAKGRVFLVDLTTSPPTWEQRNLNLPDDVVAATSKKSAEGLVKKVLTSLAKQEAKVKAFIEAAGK